MIELHAWPTPNGIKISIMLEECGLPFTSVPIDIRNGDQFKPDFLKISPNNKVPAIVDPDGPDGKPISLFESGAILIYLAEKTGKFIPADAARRWTVTQWVFFQMASIGPMFGQLAHFDDYAGERIQYALDRYHNEARRLYKVLDTRLGQSPFIGDAEYSVADMAVWPWIQPARQRMKMEEYPNLKRWYDVVGARPAVQAGVKVGTDVQKIGAIALDEEQRKSMFGRKF